MQTNRHQIDRVEVAFVGTAAVSFLVLLASIGWLLTG
jgi:hypothetical protein